jgi:putative oxidoreductase
MVYHGAGKLKPGAVEETAGYFESLDIKPSRFWAVATGIAEAASGALMLLGVGTRLAALGVLVTQGVAVAKVHADKGYDNMKGGFEYNLTLMAVAAALLLRGPGKLSVHEWLEHRAQGRGLCRSLQAMRRRRLIRAIKLLK